MKRDYYEILDIARNASDAEIKRAYRKLARKHHPDVNHHDEQAEERFKEINEAYNVLSDPKKRQLYDTYGHDGLNGRASSPGYGFNGFGDFGLGDIVDAFFGGGTRTRRRPVGEDGADLRYDLEISLEEVATGTDKNLRISRMRACEDCHGSGAKEGTSPQTCAQCQGTGQVRTSQQTIFVSFSTLTQCTACRGYGYIITNPCTACNGNGRKRIVTEQEVKIPAGVEDGMRIRLRGEGDAGARGGISGDLYIIVHVKAHGTFQRRGDDILLEVPLSFIQATLGDTIKAPTIYGKEEKLDIPAGTQPGALFRLKGKGLPNIDTGVHGDQVIIIKLTTPKKLNSEQKKLLLDLAESMDLTVNPSEDKSIIEKLLGQ